MQSESMLFISPVVPSLTGNGLAMRAAHTLSAFATRYRVTLLVLVRYGSPAGFKVPPELSALCKAAFVVPVFHGGTAMLRPVDRTVRETLAAERVDIVHIFRLDTVPYAEPWLPKSAVEHWLDLDDVESATHRRIAALHRSSGDEENEARELALAASSEQAEIAALQRFDRVFLASAHDLDRLPLSGPASLHVLPNVLPLPEPIPKPPESGPFVFLFIGTLAYFPNWEGVCWLIEHVWPIVRASSVREVEFHVAGRGPTEQLDRFIDTPGVKIVGPVDNVRTVYACAHAVVVPLRAGGGTRIKIIEAFGFQRPVVSTTIGVEGIEAVPDRDIIVADDVEAFANAMLDLVGNEKRRGSLAANAHQLHQERYTPAHLENIIRGL